MAKKTTEIPVNLEEQYYQITPAILASFPKYRPAVDLYHFNEAAQSLVIFAQKGQRLSNEQVEDAARLCAEGTLFVARSDHKIYAKHICKQLDLVLVDEHLTPKEISTIFIEALTMRLTEFFEQPIMVTYEALRSDIMVLTEYLSQDYHRIKSLMRRLLLEHNLVNHSINSGIIGLWLYGQMHKGDLVRKSLDRTAEGMFLHDMGMSRLPQFIRDKTQVLTPEEKQKLIQHPLIGMKIVAKLAIGHDPLTQCVMEHHERLDGSGYPRKIGAAEISPLGRFCAVVDSFAAMITKRPYAEPMPPLEAAAALLKDSGKYDERFSKAMQTGWMLENIPAPQPAAPAADAPAQETASPQ